MMSHCSLYITWARPLQWLVWPIPYQLPSQGLSVQQQQHVFKGSASSPSLVFKSQPCFAVT